MNFDSNGSWLEERLFERRIVLCRGTLDGPRLPAGSHPSS